MQDPGELLRQTSIIVCTVERLPDLARCLESLHPFRTAGAEIIVVDNGPHHTAITEMAQRNLAKVVVEPRRGVSRARNAGIRKATGAILAFLDDDSVADRNWLPLLLAPLQEGRVAAVVGSIGAQTLADPVSRAFDSLFRAWFPTSRVMLEASPGEDPLPLRPALLANANLAIRREAFARVGGFDERFGRGTRIGSGEEPEMLLRLLLGGEPIVVEPAARILHRHPTERQALRRWSFLSASAHTAILTKYFLQDPDLRGAILRYTLRRAVRRRRPPESAEASARMLPTIPFLVGSLYGPLAFLLSRPRRGLQQAGHFSGGP